MLLFLAACGGRPAVDAGVVDAGRDAGVVDAGVIDAGDADAGVADAGDADAGVEDAGAADAGEPDAGAVDAGAPDAGSEDAGAPDAGEADAGDVDAGPCARASGVGAPFRFRAMAANLTSGNFQSYDPGHGIRIIQGLNPDVVMIQELNYAAGMEAFLAALDAGYAYTRGAGQIPNGVLSRFPIVDAGEWDDPYTSNREFTWALIDLPGPRDVVVVSVHLLTASATVRNDEANALLGLLDANVSARDFLLVGGDFNTDVAGEPAFTTLARRATTGSPPPADQSGNPNTNAGRTKPYDHVLVSSCLERHQLDAGLVFDSRVYMPLSDVAPVQQSDSAAFAMQHMGVVKDFVIQP